MHYYGVEALLHILYSCVHGYHRYRVHMQSIDSFTSSEFQSCTCI